MTRLLTLAIERLNALSDTEQDIIARFILSRMDYGKTWDDLFAASHDILSSLADDAINEDEAMKTSRSELDPASYTTKSFTKLYKQLKPSIQKKAKHGFSVWRQMSGHPGLKLDNICSVYINDNHMALGTGNHQRALWFWIGDRNQYEQLIKHKKHL